MWQKKGLLFDIAKYKTSLRQSHGAIPFALHTEGNLFRIFFSSRNEKGQSLPYYIESEIKDGTITLTGEPVGPVFGLGELGSFDDSGIMPICCVKNEGVVYMYYVGWNPQVTVSYRHAIGLAVSHDNGKTFERFSIGPVCDRSLDEPFFNSSPFVMVENGVWRMWYISCTNWQIINNYPEPSYLAKYAESENGIHWKKDGIVCLDYDERAKAIARLSVIKIGDEYNMYFS
ncbi:MAG TPA: hypothetical protein VG603_01085, partial [Chitinophagales bacterium]|nr:hypothetical protein [Chitinophagales bacterium]